MIGSTRHTVGTVLRGPVAALTSRPTSDTYLKDVEKRSGVTFQEAQVAQAREWIGDGWQDGSIRELKIFEAKGNVGGGLQLEGDAKKSDGKAKTFPLPQDRAEAKRTVDRFEDTAKDALGGSQVSDNVGHHAMKGTGSLWEERWLGSEEEELNWYARLSLRRLRADPPEHKLCLGAAVHPLKTDDCRRPKGNRTYIDSISLSLLLTCRRWGLPISTTVVRRVTATPRLHLLSRTMRSSRRL